MRNHPAMYNAVYPVHKRPLVVRTNVDYEFTTITVDQVTAADGNYEVLFLGTGERTRNASNIFLIVLKCDLLHNKSISCSLFIYWNGANVLQTIKASKTKWKQNPNTRTQTHTYTHVNRNEVNSHNFCFVRDSFNLCVWSQSEAVNPLIRAWMESEGVSREPNNGGVKNPSLEINPM